jgi:hypothetical protein
MKIVTGCATDMVVENLIRQLQIEYKLYATVNITNLYVVY